MPGVCSFVRQSVEFDTMAQIPLGSTRHDSTRSTLSSESSESNVSSVTSVTECVEPCFSNMADDEEAVVLVCTSLVFFLL